MKEVSHFGKGRVYVIDDERLIAESLAEILRICGFDATAFVQGARALEQSKLLPPDLVITDVQMPGMNGIELAQKMVPSCPVILLSGQAATDAMLKKSQLQGRNFRVLAKPTDPDELLLAIEELGI